MGKARSWGLAKTLRITFYCGLGHILGSVLLGSVGIVAGAQLASLVEIEGMRGNLAGWALAAFGLVYLAWGLKQAGRSQRHSHLHIHDEVVSMIMSTITGRITCMCMRPARAIR
jgi:hypothetical protein